MLTIHNSLIMRKVDASYLEDGTRKAFYDKFESDIKIKYAVFTERFPFFHVDGTVRTDQIAQDHKAHAHCYDRNTVRLVRRGP